VASFTPEHQRKAIAARWAGTTPEDRRRATAKARREHAVREIVAGWPELTEEQQQRLRALLRPVGGDLDGRA
jgi:hypothetical protein